MDIRKRYSEFDDFRWRLTQTFPGFEAAVPELPPKSLISRFRPRFLEKRRAGLQYFLKYVRRPRPVRPVRSPSPLARYLVLGGRGALVLVALLRFPACRLTSICCISCILLNPEFAGSVILKEFLFS